jgi:hypothetical protein
LKALDQRLHAANMNKSVTQAPVVAPMVASLNTSGEEGLTATTMTTQNEAKNDEAT